MSEPTDVFDIISPADAASLNDFPGKAYTIAREIVSREIETFVITNLIPVTNAALTDMLAYYSNEIAKTDSRTREGLIKIHVLSAVCFILSEKMMGE